ncbi:MAG: hypothetical protein CBC35_03160 [Planctomycetes bacterium TMED75]|nr:hypothetical protein [Planctomycetaceae bacterium]OUU94898.1 MAG: hypothetical protein CBC35_03160 [Planctomycetes bacterium TMED75]
MIVRKKCTLSSTGEFMSEAHTTYQPHHLRRILTKITAVLLVIAGIAVMGYFFGQYVKQFEGWVQSIGFWGPVIFIIAFLILTGLQVPESVLAVAAGASFGLAEGITLVIVVNIAGAIIWFWAARLLFSGIVNRFMGKHPKLAAIEQATADEGFKLMVLLRLGPFSYGFLNLALGASKVRFWPYTLALIGVIPGNFATVYFGSLATHVARKTVKQGSEDNLSSAHFYMMGFGFLITLIVVVIIAHVARHTLKKYELEHPIAPTPEPDTAK